MYRAILEEGSFRDPEGSVFYYENEVYRTLSPKASDRMKNLLESPFFNEWVKEGKIVKTEFLKSSDIFPKNYPATKNILWHERIPFVTYPFEWSFLMLKDAALLTLDLIEVLLKHNFILKDGTAWNICFLNGSPRFYDILSIDSYREGQPWEGFSQFLQEFLYPLMFQAYGGETFQDIWRSTQQGIPVSLLCKTLSKRTFLFKKGVFKYVYLQEKFSSNKTISKSTLQNEFSAQTFPKSILLKLLKDLRVCIESLHVKNHKSVWKDYDSQNTYETLDVKEKEKFIEESLKKMNSSVLIDLGCNTGHYSRIVQKKTQVISCDLDPTCIDYIYAQKNKNILPVVLDLMKPSPNMGWELNERKSIFTRLKADTFLALALIHHLCITHNLPLVKFVKFLKFISPRGIVEWVDKTDPMVQFLLRNRKDIFEDYTLDTFQEIISQEFKIENTISLNNGSRRLFWLTEK